MLPSSENYYRGQQALSVIGMLQARQAWDRIHQHDIAASWEAESIRLLSILEAAQLQAATAGIDYIENSLTDQQVDAPVVGKVDPAAFVGIASDGRTLAGLLELPRIRTLVEIRDGATFADAFQAGRTLVDRIAVTQIQDAGRVASGVAITARPDVAGYIRVLNPPSCSRCIMLAGRFYRWSSGFQRHIKCDCFHVPITDRGESLATPIEQSFIDQPHVTDPKVYFDSLSREEQDRVFSTARAQAIRDGADMSAVVNSRRGVFIAGDGLRATTVGSGRRALAGQRLRASGQTDPIRLTPESIYRMSEGDRAIALDLLHLHGYVL